MKRLLPTRLVLFEKTQTNNMSSSRELKKRIKTEVPKKKRLSHLNNSDQTFISSTAQSTAITRRTMINGFKILLSFHNTMTDDSANIQVCFSNSLQSRFNNNQTLAASATFLLFVTPVGHERLLALIAMQNLRLTHI